VLDSWRVSTTETIHSKVPGERPEVNLGRMLKYPPSPKILLNEAVAQA